jgi:hypothetical protein
MEERIPMSQKDLNRLDIFAKVKEKQLKQIKWDEILGIHCFFKLLDIKYDSFIIIIN